MAVARGVDVERVVALWLAQHAELAALNGRAYTVTPKDVGADPFLLVRRVGGDPPLSRPAVLDAPTLQVDVYGGTRRQASQLAQLVVALISELSGPVDDGDNVGHVTGTRIGPLRYLPDEVWQPARPRYVLDVDVYARRAAQGPSGSSSIGAAVTASSSAP